jgi:RNA polymerase sigma-70 factor, ECF subfamily
MANYTKLEEWFIGYGSDIHHYLVYCTGRSPADDLVQDVFVKALKGLHQFEGKSSPKTWLFAIARRVALDDRRRRAIASLLPIRLAKAIKSNVKSPEEVVFIREEVATVNAIVRKLKTNYRDVLLLRIMEDFTVSETAEILNWSNTRVNVTLHRALQQVRERYMKLDGGEELVSTEERG